MSAKLPPLAELDPVEAWKPWRPGPSDPWNLKWAAHLYRRAAFGAPPLSHSPSAWEGLQRTVKDGLDTTLEHLFQEGPGQAEYERVMDGLAPGSTRNYYSGSPNDPQGRELQAWWLHRMVHTASPLRERMTFFWHNHFATSVAKVRQPALMVRQNQLFRQHALGKFRQFLLDVSRDPAMLLWLDSNTNVKAKPNENYARELMELFTLGPGNYTEQDIREIARAFTGWHTTNSQFVSGRRSFQPGQGSPEDSLPAYAFNAAEHDEGKKTVLGQTGNWNGQDVLRILLEQPAAARFLARKLYRAFLSDVDNPPDALIEPLAEQLRRSDYDIGEAVRTILRSRLFFSNHAYRRRIKSPVEYVLGLVRSLDAETAPRSLALAMEGLGQTLFAPPNVKGWEGGRAWLNSLTLVARHNQAWAVLSGAGFRMPQGDYYDGSPPEPVRTDVVRLVREHGGGTPERQVDFLIDLFLQGDCDPAARGKLVEFHKGPGKSGDRGRRLLETVHSVVLLPEYQLS